MGHSQSQVGMGCPYKRKRFNIILLVCLHLYHVNLSVYLSIQPSAHILHLTRHVVHMFYDPMTTALTMGH